MRVTAVILGLIFGGIVVMVDSQANAAGGVLIGGIGIIAAVLTWINPRAGQFGFSVAVGLAALAMVTNSDPGYVVYVAMFGIPALFAWRSAERNKAAVERAERTDRYVRQQLGEETHSNLFK